MEAGFVLRGKEFKGERGYASFEKISNFHHSSGKGLPRVSGAKGMRKTPTKYTEANEMAAERNGLEKPAFENNFVR